MREINNIRNRRYNDVSFEELETIRSNLGLIGRDPQSGKVVAGTPGEQANRLAGIVQDDLDDFFTNLDVTQVSAGDPQRAVDLVQRARQQYTNARKGEILEQVLTRTDLSRNARPAIEELQKRLEPIVADDRLMAKFTRDEQEVLRSLQSGNITERALNLFGQLAPDVKTMPGLAKLTAYAVPSTVAASTISPAYGAAVGTVGGAALASRAMANRMAMRRASDVAEAILQGRPPATTSQSAIRAAGRGGAYVPPVVLGSEAPNNAFLTDAYGNAYDVQGNRMAR
jgi:hypothetical protein